MKHRLTWLVVGLALALTVPALYADVKTREKTQVKFEGIMGGITRLFGGSAARDGVTSTVAVKGNRKSSMSDTTGEIVDLTEERVYRVDVKKKEYKVVTFEQLRKEWQEAQAEAKKNAEKMQKEQEEQGPPAKELEFTVDVKETGQKKNLAGYDTREVILTITGHEKGKTLEEGGGFVLTNTMWLAPRIAALDEIMAFNIRYWKAIAGEDFGANAQQMATLLAMFPSMQTMTEKMRAEGRKLAGSAIMTTTTFETVKSEEQMKGSQQSRGTGGGGITGRLTSRLGRGASQQKTTVFTSIYELLSVAPSADAADVAIAAGFKEKK